MRRLLMVALLLPWGCSETVDGGECAQDADCPVSAGGAPQTCLYDLDRSTTYCTPTCVDDDDCPSFQSCRTSQPNKDSDATSSYCVDRVRSCDVERCNGYDDDCDGVIDEADCELITGCLDDIACDGWVCQVPENQPLAVCQAPNEAATKADYERCTQDSDCKNNICDTGFCAPLCRPLTDCPSYDGKPTMCASAVGPGARPEHNTCQIVCNSPRDCLQGQECVWRTVYQTENLHGFVCSLLDDGRLPLGAACPNNEPTDGDAMCQHGLCFQNRCTRPCGGPGSDCSDVGASPIACTSKRLRYGDQEFAEFICAAP